MESRSYNSARNGSSVSNQAQTMGAPNSRRNRFDGCHHLRFLWQRLFKIG
jgi:hypothetical protein